MPNTKSAIKDIKQANKSRLSNDKYKKTIKEVLKNGDVQKIYKALDKGAKKGVIAKERAARKKSQAAKALQSLPANQSLKT